MHNSRIAYHIICLHVCIFWLTSPLAAQNDPDEFSDILEAVIQDLEQDGDFDYDATFERLSAYLNRPADLNRDDLRDFVTMGLLTDGHLFALQTHIQSVGPLLSVLELQSVPGFDLDVIRRIRPFVRVGGALWDMHQPLKNLIFQGDNQIAMRWTRTVQEQRGYTPDDSGEPRFEGDPNRLYLRFRHRNENRMSYGVTMEKDPGEAFFAKSNGHGFDFYSYHIFLHNYRKWIPRLAIGDYNINLGQGLVLHSGYGIGKSAFVTQIKKGGYVVRPFASVNEADFLRGGAVTISPGERTEFTVFASSRLRDANVQVDTLDTGDEPLAQESFTSLQLSGLHRTESEIEDERQIRHSLAGAAFRYKSGSLRLGANILYQHLSSPFQRGDALYNRYKFQGTNLLNTSVEYAYLYRNVHFFGETAMSDNGAIASVNGLLVGLHRRADLAILGRWLPRDYQSIGANPFAETSSGDNEYGIYAGIEVRPTVRWTFSAYSDVWKHPWLRFNVDGPSTGQEQLLRLTYKKKRSFECYVQYRHEVKEKNLTANAEPFDPLVDASKQNVRLHFSYKVAPAVELRSRIEGAYYQEHTLPAETGFVVYQDLLYKPIGSPFSFTTRIALFDTDSFNTAIYAYENDLVNQFYIPAYAYRGARYYLNMRYRGIRNLSLELRLAQTRYTDRDEIGSGNDLIEGNIKTDVKAQVMWNF